jgi:hypothetical protein
MALFQYLDLEAFLERARDRLFRVDVFAGPCGFARNGEMLLVGVVMITPSMRGSASKLGRSGALATPNSCANIARFSCERL